ncbi:Uncharacterised protein [Enterobacter cloacae]|nr:Uncharacterised protein [Enterobacter cloacae]SAJ27499.1 Uncharacterised protein [Enterobacter cloacae]
MTSILLCRLSYTFLNGLHQGCLAFAVPDQVCQ